MTEMSETVKSLDGLLSEKVMAAVSPRCSMARLLEITTVGPCDATALTTLAALSRPPLTVVPRSDAIGSALSISRLFSWSTVSD